MAELHRKRVWFSSRDLKKGGYPFESGDKAKTFVLSHNCPVITAEDFYPQEVADNHVSKAVNDYILSSRKEAAKFLTGLIPAWGGVASGIVDLLFGFFKEKKWSGSCGISSLNAIVSTFVTEYIGKKKASETIKNFA